MITKLSVKKVSPDPEEPVDDKKPKKNTKLKVKKDKTETTSQYGLYNGIVTDKGAKDNPSETEAVINMANYMKNNNPPESTNPSNVYRPKFSHVGIVFDRKRKLNDA